MPRGVNDYDAGELQGRNVANSNSVNIISPGIITDGLVLHLDAGNYVSYPASGANWNNLTDNRIVGALSGTYSFVRDGGGAIDFSKAVNSSANLGSIFNFTSQTFSFRVFFYLTSEVSSSSVQGPMLFYKGPYQTRGYFSQLSKTSPSAVNFVTNQSGATQVTFSNSLVIVGAWNDICIVRNGSSVRTYINGVDQTSSAATHSNPTGASDNFLINSYGTDFFGDVTYSIFSVYDRDLSPTEVSQNFNATRARFGI